MKRHFFLTFVLLFLLAQVQVSIIINHDAKGNVIQNIDVIVIGAGIAGMTAANQLAKNGKNILVLEANQYIGGRMKSVPVTLMDNSTFNFQYGANWIHGNSKMNPLNSLSKQVPNVTLIKTDDQSSVVYDENGNQISDQVDQEWDIYQNIIDQIDQYQNTSVYDAINAIDSTKVNDQIFMYIVSNDIQFETSSTISDLSAQWGQDDASFPGDDYLVTSRYQAFVQYLSKKDKIQVLLNHKVNEVSYNQQNNTSTVNCQNGKTFSAKKIIIAVPLGVLKQETIDFVPQLPSWKKSAIQELHMGNVCKILIVPKKKINVTDSDNYIGVVSSNVNKRGAATYFLNLASLAKIPAYMTFGLGPNADELQNMSQQSLKKLIADKMSIFAEDTVNQNDFDIIRSSWRNSSNFGGAYTYSSTTSTSQDWLKMAKPIFENGWYFCGEHTSSKYRGTVHGAYLTGKHTAQYIINNVNSSNWKYGDKS